MVKITDNPFDYVPEPENKCPDCGGPREEFNDGAGLYCPKEDKYWRFA